MGDSVYIVQRGECMASVAAGHGFTWQFLWSLPQNQSLKDLRKNSNVLMEGDEVFIPAKREKDVSCVTDKRHKFVRKGVLSKFRVRLLAYGQPRTEVRYRLIAGMKSFEGMPDTHGNIAATVPADLKSVLLTVYDGDIAEHYTVRLGDLDPLTEWRGIQQRLLNLGLPCSVTGEFDDYTKAALQMFQEQHDLPGDGKLTDDTREAIQRQHGA